jgi:hypothetical protein
MKLSLDNLSMVDDFLDSTHFLGIVAPMKGYQFCWSLNHYLGMDFRYLVNERVEMRRSDRRFDLNLYHYQSEQDHEHTIYQNQYDGRLLFTEFKHLDFIWMIRMEEYQKDLIPDLIESLKSMDTIQLVTTIHEGQFKNPENLIL